MAESNAPWGDGREAFRRENHANWDERALLHAQSAGYGTAQLIADDQALSGVVEFDRSRLGDISGLRVLHLQCHIGTDTISLARLGAHVTGLDFSGVAIAQGRLLAQTCGVDVTFVEGDVYDAARLLGEQSFDLVYTGIGALCWLPRIDSWANVVSALLAREGRLFLREGHPVLWSIDERVVDQLVIGYPYFETVAPMTFDEPLSYVEISRPLAASRSHSWNHGVGEIVTALLNAGLRITAFTEHDSVPWNALPGQMVEDANGEWRLHGHPERLPLSYTLIADR